jgi:regulator of protease activity HflC (stomatin/prohibitin superfamily)
MEATAYRQLDRLIEEGIRPAALRSTLEEYPPERRGDLSRYVWGMLDQRYGEEEEAALWLYAWALRDQTSR